MDINKGEDLIVLRTNRYSESSLMVSAYTKNLGLITINAKGASRKNSKTAKFFREFTRASLDLKRGKNYYYVQDGYVIDSNFKLSTNPPALVLASFFSELILKTSYEEEPNEDIFHLLDRGLMALNEAYSKLILISFSIKFLAVSGYKMEPHCSVCSRREDLYFYENLRSFFCRSHLESLGESRVYRLSDLEVKVIKTILHRKISDAVIYEKYLSENEIRRLNAIYLKAIMSQFELEKLRSLTWLEKYEFI